MATAAAQAITANNGASAAKSAAYKPQGAPAPDSFEKFLAPAASTANPAATTLRDEEGASSTSATRDISGSVETQQTARRDASRSRTGDTEADRKIAHKADDKAKGKTGDKPDAEALKPDADAVAAAAAPTPAPAPASMPAPANDSDFPDEEPLEAINAGATGGANSIKNDGAKNGDAKSAAARPQADAADAILQGVPNFAGMKPVAAEPETGDSRNGDAKDGHAAKPDNSSTPAAAKTHVADMHVQSADASASQPAAPPPASAPASMSAAATGVNPVASLAPAPVLAATLVPAPQTAAPDLGMIAVAIAAKSGANAKQFDIRLDPPELGHVQVRLSIDEAGKTSAHLTAEQPGTLDMLQRDSTNLERALRDAGLDVAQNGLNFSLRGESSQGDSASRTPFARTHNLTVQAVQTPDPASGVITMSASDARIDIRV